MLVLLVVLSSAIMLWLPLFSLSRTSIVTPMFFMLIPLSFLFISKFKKIRKKLRLKRKFSMLLLLTIVLLVTVSIARLFSGTMFQIKPVCAWWDNNWDYCRKITINSDKVDEELTNFTVLVYLDSSRINWTNVQDDLDDLRFIANDNTTLLKYEIENYTANSEAWLWVKIPSVSNTSDTFFYMYYGNNACSSGEHAQNVWDSNFKMVHHMNDYNTTHIVDSTSNDNDGTKKGVNEPIETSNGKIDDAQYFDGTNDYIALGSSASLQITNGTFMAWVKTSDAGSSYRDILDYPHAYGLWTKDNIFGVYDWGSGGWKSSGTAINDGNWHQVVFVKNYNVASGSVFYVDGVQVGSAITYASNTHDSDLKIGIESTSSSGEPFNGTIDEVRISNIARSGAWINASYYSGKDELLTFGSEECGNTAPTNEGITITNMDDTNYLYPQKRDYLFQALYNDTDATGTGLYHELDFVMIAFTDGTNWVNASFQMPENNWALQSGSSVADIVSGSCSNSTLGNQLTATFAIRLQWDIVDALNIELYQWCNDTSNAIDGWEQKQIDYFNIESDLETSFSIDDDRGNAGQSITASGTVTYAKLGGSSVYPPDAEFTSVSVYDSSNNNEGTDSIVVNGAWSIAFNAPATVGIDTYNLYIDMADADYADAEETTHTDTFITDKAVVYWTEVDDSWVDINTVIEVRYKIVLDYDDHVVTSGDTVNINGSSATWDATGYWKRSITQASVGNWTFAVSSVSEADYSITSFTTNCTNLWGVWDNIIVSDKGRTDDRTNINEYEQFWFTLRNEFNSTSMESSSVTLNGSLSATWISGNSRWEYNTTKASAQHLVLYVASVNWDTFGITSLSDQSSNTTKIIWDSVTISITDPSDQRININTNATGIHVSGTYDYDSTSYDGTINLNNTTFEYATAQRQGYTVTSISGDTYSITAISTNDETYCIWDRIDITIVADSYNPTVGTQVNMTITAIYNYSGIQVTSWTVNIYRNSTHYATDNFTDTQYGELAYLYTTENVTESTYGLTAFSSDTITVTWGGLEIQIYTITVTDGRIDVNTNGYIYFHCRFSGNQSDCASGTLYVNASGYSINATGWAEVSASFSTVDKRIYTVTGVNVNGETDFNQIPSNPEVIWDSLSISISGPTDQRIDIGSNASGIIVSAKYDYDGASFDGTLTLNDTIYNYNTVGKRGYTVSSASGDSYGITAISSNDETYCIWDRILVYYFQVNDTRTDLNSYVNVTAKAELEYDHHALGTGDSLSFNSTTLIWNGASFTNNTLTKTIVGNWTLTIDSANENTYGITACTINITSPWVVFDRVNITSFSVTDNRINVGATASFSVSGEYEYDGAAWSGTYALNDTASKSNVGRYNYSISSITDSNYGLTVFQQSAPDVYVIFDRINVTISADGTYVLLNTQVNFTVTAIYEFDSNPVTSWTVNIYRNSTHFATGNFTDTQASSSVYEYTTENITESTFRLTGFQSNIVTVEWYNRPPVVSFTYSPEFPITGETVTFDASTSYDPDGTIKVYKWDFGDTHTGTGVIVDHTYLTYGIYNVTLMVTDSEGLSDSLTQTIRILIWPAANFTYSPKYPLVNQTVEFDGSLSYDPDGAILEYTWDFGDGNVTTVQNPLIMHAYQETDTYLVTLTIKDSDGLSNSITKQVIVYSVLIPDIAVLNVQTAYSQVYQGYALIIKVTVFNEGYSTETFNVTAYANNNIIETLTVSNLPPDEQMILTFRWDTNGFAEYQDYTISAYAHPVPREIDTEDNTFVDGVVRLVHIGDVNNDGQVRVDDILAIALAFGSGVGDPKYHPNLDITCDGKIRIDDVLAAVLNFGWTRP